MSAALYTELRRRLGATMPSERLLTDPLSTLALGTDASFYRLIPRLVVRLESEQEALELLRQARQLHLPLTFRAAGTSLSGQAVSDSVLALLSPPAWNAIRVSEDATLITLGPAVVGAAANRVLAPRDRKIGPDPASINAAMIGGIVANNASGMCCGTAQNSYRTLAGLRIILADGTVLDTRDPASRRRFRETHPETLRRIDALRGRILGSGALAERIRRKYTMKNTTGYGLNAFIDFDDPIDIIEHLMVGSEGTLGFLSEITLRTVPEHPCKASALMLFHDLETASGAVPLLKAGPADAVELMDRASLRSVEDKPGMPPFLASLAPGVTALLVETRAPDPERLRNNVAALVDAVAPSPQVNPPAFTADAAGSAALWNIRKGLFPSVGAMRRTGTTCIIEDVAFPVARLAEATMDLHRLFDKHGYQDAIIFGHALEGNLHFVFNQDFNGSAEITRYEKFIADVTSMVVNRFDGSLKAEHGTGRNMAPFVPLEWGDEAYHIMREIKQILDPDGILNPGVIINDDPRAHLRSLKPLPATDPIVDKCIECGFCEVRCPSRNLTLTPRQRIVLAREMSRLESSGSDPDRLADLAKRFRYAGDETCATDGLCALSCPVGINTGALVKQLRKGRHGTLARAIAAAVGRHMAAATALGRAFLNLVASMERLLGPAAMEWATRGIRSLSGGRLPAWNRALPMGARFPRSGAGPAAAGPLTMVYLPSCITRTMGPAPREDVSDGVVERTHTLLLKAGCRIIYPERLSDLCCGMAFDSKGFKAEGARKAGELEAALLKASDGGRYPVLVDMSPCLLHMKETLNPTLRLYEPAEFILRFLAGRLVFHPLPGPVMLHATCSTIRMGRAADLLRLAGMCAENVIAPDEIECCGWAGDRGFTFPELNASALAPLRKAVPTDARHGYSTSRTCEIGLTLHSGIPYRSIIYLVDEATSPRTN